MGILQRLEISPMALTLGDSVIQQEDEGQKLKQVAISWPKSLVADKRGRLIQELG